MIIQILSYAIPIIAILYILNVVMKRMGLIQSGKEKRNTRKEKEAAKAFINSDLLNPEYHKGKSYTQLPDSVLEKHAKSINQAVTQWIGGTDEALIYSTFKQLNNKMNVSQLSEKYYQLYEDNMMADLVNDLDNEELAILQKIIDSLPKR